MYCIVLLEGQAARSTARTHMPIDADGVCRAPRLLLSAAIGFKLRLAHVRVGSAAVIVKRRVRTARIGSRCNAVKRKVMQPAAARKQKEAHVAEHTQRDLRPPCAQSLGEQVGLRAAPCQRFTVGHSLHEQLVVVLDVLSQSPQLCSSCLHALTVHFLTRQVPATVYSG
jgi:hypothetical protein